MKISVVIPTYNSVRTIRETLDSVFRQTYPAYEIILLDDGSTDDTRLILRSYQPQIAVITQENRGVAAARNALCERAQGDLIAFLDHDDVWHPRYLETQNSLFKSYPQAAASFTGHINFVGSNAYTWEPEFSAASRPVHVLPPVEFAKRYNEKTGDFASMSFCCVSKSALSAIGSKPFWECSSGADDFYFFNLLPLYGPVVFMPKPLVAYRMTPDAQSSDRLKGLRLSVEALKVLGERYKASNDPSLIRSYRLAYASRRRQYAKFLMGAGKTAEARGEICGSLRAASLGSCVKSWGLLLLTLLPRSIQPAWPRSSRVIPAPSVAGTLKF